MICPRSDENGFRPKFAGPDDHWREDATCSYCGSLNPDVFMDRCEAGDVELGPTDKNYKVYVENRGGAAFSQRYRDCPVDAICTGPDDCTHWVTRRMDRTKFYFQHLSAEQRIRFVELMNTHTVKIGVPGYFYVTPFFARRIGPENAA